MIAKGAQRPKSRFGGLLESFTEGDAQFFAREGRDLHTLGGFDLLKSRQSIGRNLVAFAGASLIAELALRFGTEESQPWIFQTVADSLDEIAAADVGRVEEIVIADVWVLVSLFGFRPETEACVGCGEPLLPEATARFDIEGGGVACVHCRPLGRALDPTSRRELRQMVEGKTSRRSFASPSLQRALVRAFLTTHLARDHTLRSLGMFLQQLG